MFTSIVCIIPFLCKITIYLIDSLRLICVRAVCERAFPSTRLCVTLNAFGIVSMRVYATVCVPVLARIDRTVYIQCIFPTYV